MLDFRAQAQAFESFLSQLTQASMFNSGPKNLYAPCTYMLSIGGKRIRPAVCLMAHELFAGDKLQDALWAATAVELFHNFTLIHDDIMDAATLRRGKETVYKHFGTTAAILSGDVMDIYAYRCLENVSEHRVLPLLKLFNQTAIEVCEGQQMDMDFETLSNVQREEYIEMIKLKTAVLLAASMKMGAICAGAAVQDAQAIYDFGLNLGIAFQLQDDYLDSFGTEAELGKLIGGDIRANKKTILAITARERASDAEKARLAALIEYEGEDKVAQTIELFKSTAADEICRNEIAHYTRQAIAKLQVINVPEERKQAFSDLLHYLMHRNS